MASSRVRSLSQTLYRWIAPFIDVRKLWWAVRGVPWFVLGWARYRRETGAEQIRFLDTWPQFGDRFETHGLDFHYYYLHAWAIRTIVAARPESHVDIGSHLHLSSSLSAFFPTTFIDFRRLDVRVPGLTCIRGNLLDLEFPSDSVPSLSCLHVAEHVGLGRYGDPIDPLGTRRACVELARVLSPGGRLYFALPIGRPRLCFNAHRVHGSSQILDYFSGLRLVEYAGVDDAGQYVDRRRYDELDGCEYGCGMFVFEKPR
jgi:hypothetical protein